LLIVIGIKSVVVFEAGIEAGKAQEEKGLVYTLKEVFLN
jgi:hypothetical protein